MYVGYDIHWDTGFTLTQAISYLQLSSLFLAAVLYAVTCVHFHLKYTVKVLPVKRPLQETNRCWPLLQATKSWAVSRDDNEFM